MIRVSSVITEPDFRMLLFFSSGERRRFDMQPYLHLPVYRPLQNPGFFGLAKELRWNYGDSLLNIIISRLSN